MESWLETLEILVSKWLLWSLWKQSYLIFQGDFKVFKVIYLLSYIFCIKILHQICNSEDISTQTMALFHLDDSSQGRLGWSSGRSRDFPTYPPLFARCGWAGILTLGDRMVQHHNEFSECFPWSFSFKHKWVRNTGINFTHRFMGVVNLFLPRGWCRRMPRPVCDAWLKTWEHSQISLGPNGPHLALRVCCSQTNGLIIGKSGSDGCKVVVFFV